MAKILVEIIGKNNQIIKRKKYKIEENKIIIEKPSKGRGKAGYKVDFTKDSIIYYYRLGFLRQKIMLIEGSFKCLDWKDGQTDFNYPTKNTIKSWFDVNVLDKASNIGTKVQIPLYVSMLIFAGLVFNFLTFLIASGRLKI